VPCKGRLQSSTSGSLSTSTSSAGITESLSEWRRLRSGVEGHGIARLGEDVDGRSGVLRRQTVGRCSVGMDSAVLLRDEIGGRRAGCTSAGRRVGCVVSS